MTRHESNRLVKLFITVDTEIWPESPGWPHTPLESNQDCARELSWYFYGGGSPDARGVPYQLSTLAAAGLKATFFVDPLFSYALGIAPLRDVVALIQKHGQEIGLHLHPEWLTDPRCPPLPAFAGPLLHGYSEIDQGRLIQGETDRLCEAGAPRPNVFRAGSWGASLATLRALASQGIGYDSSFNARFGSSFPDIDIATRNTCTQPAMLEGVCEFPVTNFVAGPWNNAQRPLHVCAASFGEFRAVLEHAAAGRWLAVVIVLHSFEFVRVGRLATGKAVASQKLLSSRFERLCEYLAANRDKFETCHFADLDRDALPNAPQPAAPVSTRTRTAWRNVEQLASRLY